MGKSGPGDPGIAINYAANIHWSDSIKEKLYGPSAKGRLDGEYLDSLEGYVTTDLNFRRAIASAIDRRRMVSCAGTSARKTARYGPSGEMKGSAL